MSHSKNQALDLKGEFSKEERKIAKKYIYGSPRLEIREMQNNPEILFYPSQNDNKQQTTSAGGDE